MTTREKSSSPDATPQALIARIDRYLSLSGPYMAGLSSTYLLREAVAALRAQQEPQWQPIETVPKDGRMVLVYPASCWTDDTECDYEVTYWDQDEERLSQFGAPDDFAGSTHWLDLGALPSPPAASPVNKERT